MEASLYGHAVKNFKRILTCMSKYGEELTMQGSDGGASCSNSHKRRGTDVLPQLQLSTVNNNTTAFCMFRFQSDFFQKFSMSREEVCCKLLVKSVISVLGRGTQAQSVDRIDLKIIDNEDELDGDEEANGRAHKRKRGHRVRREAGRGEENEDRSAKLVIKLICKHGILKTHSLNLSRAILLLPTVDPNSLTSRFVAPAKTLKDWIDHFSLSGSTTSQPATGANGTNKYESDLGWYFSQQEIRVKTFEGGGKKGLSTEIKVDPEEFEEYQIGTPAVTMTFPMREFLAAFALAESISIGLETSFSEGGQPLSIRMSLEAIDAEFVIATTVNQTFAELVAEQEQQAKEEQDDGTVAGSNKRKVEESRQTPARSGSRAPTAKKRASLHLAEAPPSHQADNATPGREPLFRPPSPSQVEMSQAVRASLGMQDMNDEEIAGMLMIDADELDAEVEQAVSHSQAIPNVQRSPELGQLGDLPLAHNGIDEDETMPETPPPRMQTPPSQHERARDDDEETLRDGEEYMAAESFALPATAMLREAGGFMPLFDD